MSNFIALRNLLDEMQKHAPRSWCKLAIEGAAYQDRLRLYARTGTMRAFVPAWTLRADDSPLPVRMRAGITHKALSEEYGIKVPEGGNEAEITVWETAWGAEPRRIGTGWHVFKEPWDWEEPAIRYEGFEIPRDFEELFGYDDLHPEGDPDTRLAYDLELLDLVVSEDDAEALVPLADFRSVLIRVGIDTPKRTGKIGRPKGAGSFVSSDTPLVESMRAELRKNPELTFNKLARKYAGEAAGHGTLDSKAKRLERRLREAF